MTDIVPLLPQLTHTPAIIKAIDSITGLIAGVRTAHDLFSKKDMIDRATDIDYQQYYLKNLPNDMLFLPIPYETLNLSNSELIVITRYFAIRSGVIFSIKHIKVKTTYHHCIGFKLDVLYPEPESNVPVVKEDVKPVGKKK